MSSGIPLPILFEEDLQELIGKCVGIRNGYENCAERRSSEQERTACAMMAEELDNVIVQLEGALKRFERGWPR